MAYVEDLGNKKHKIYVDMGYARGKRVRRTKTVTVTSDRDLKNKIRDFEFKCMQEVDEPIDNISFAKFVDKWLTNYVEVNLKSSTLETYEYVLKSGLLEYFSKMKMKDIKKYHVVEYFTKEVQEDKPSITNKNMVLKSIFSKAVEWEVIKDNPARNVKAKNQNKREVNYYSKNELDLLFESIKDINPKYKTIIKLAAIGGLRRAEILGIREESINYEENYIYVDKQLRYTKFNKRFYMSSVKNNKPRYVYFPSEFMEELKSYHVNFKKLRMQMGNLWEPLKDKDGDDVNLIFVKSNGFPTHLNTLGVQWRKIIKKLGLKYITFHELRHSCASLMVKKGVNFKVIQERLGHSNIGITLDLYSHLEEDMHKESTKVFDEIL